MLVDPVTAELGCEQPRKDHAAGPERYSLCVISRALAQCPRVLVLVLQCGMLQLRMRAATQRPQWCVALDRNGVRLWKSMSLSVAPETTRFSVLISLWKYLMG
mmetsp:Transcript_18425/g.43313  ORF Transcript_18425/g.43313 Transcript_18425/m.43313 type:complete len:103 (-) Transcript_18425:90-398(-)